MHEPIWFGCQQYLDHFNTQPTVVKSHSQDTETHRRYLWTKLYSVYAFTLPENWPVNWFRFWLFQYGSIAVIYTKEFGWIAQPYSITALDLYYQPASILVTNHMFKTDKQGKIGVNAQVVHLMDDYWGLSDLVNKYASMLAQIDKDIQINLMNANVSLVSQVKSKKQGDSVAEAYGQATEGKPLVIVNEDLLKDKALETLIPSPKQNYIVGELLQARRNVVNQFLTDVGIPNFNMDKKAQQNDTEILENEDETKAIAAVILKNLRTDFEKVRAISGLDVSVRLRPNYAKGGLNSGKTDTNGDVPA